MLLGLLQLVKRVRCSWTPHLSVDVCLHARCLSCYCSWCRYARSWNLEKWPPVASHLPQSLGEAEQSGGGRQIFTRLHWLKCQRCGGRFKCVNLVPWIWKWSPHKELQTCLLWLPDLRNKGISAAGVMCVVGWESPRAEGSEVQLLPLTHQPEGDATLLLFLFFYCYKVVRSFSSWVNQLAEEPAARFFLYWEGVGSGTDRELSY